jgi:hypothetical protein
MNTITDEQRKAFSELIKQQQKRLADRYDGYMKSLRTEWEPKLQGRSKVQRVMEEIRHLRGKLSEHADNLRHLGYRVIDDGFISVDYDVAGDTTRQLEESIKAAEVERDQQESQFRRAFFDVWSAENVDEAREIVARVLS